MKKEKHGSYGLLKRRTNWNLEWSKRNQLVEQEIYGTLHEYATFTIRDTTQAQFTKYTL